MLRLVSSLALLLVATPIQAATIVWSISGTIAQIENSSGYLTDPARSALVALPSLGDPWSVTVSYDNLTPEDPSTTGNATNADFIGALLSLELELGGETYAFSEDGSAPAAAGASDFNDVFLNDQPGSDFVDFASVDFGASPSGGDYALEQFSVDVFSTLPGFIASLVLADDPFDTAQAESGSFAWIFLDVDGATVQQDLLIGTVTAASFSIVPAPPAALLFALALAGVGAAARLRR